MINAHTTYGGFNTVIRLVHAERRGQPKSNNINLTIKPIWSYFCFWLTIRSSSLSQAETTVSRTETVLWRNIRAVNVGYDNWWLPIIRYRMTISNVQYPLIAYNVLPRLYFLRSDHNCYYFIESSKYFWWRLTKILLWKNFKILSNLKTRPAQSVVERNFTYDDLNFDFGLFTYYLCFCVFSYLFFHFIFIYFLGI